MRDARLIAAGEDNFRIGFIVVLLLYVAIYGCLLLATNGLPYIFDNNETFSSIVHAKNMFTYGVGETYGLTDESYGRTAESHPYVYTHQGNFPRLFALLIYWLGAQSAEAQIVVTTFTVGTIGLYFAYALVARRSNWLIGVMFCALMMTDYVMIAQWQVVTWRVWHMSFFFFPLWCIDRASLAPSRTWPWLLAMTIDHATMFYFELTFAAFTAITTSVFALITLRRRLHLAVAIVLAQIAGVLSGIAVLVIQLWAYLGWENFLTDLQLTYFARNEAIQGNTKSALAQFMAEHRIVFWFNINADSDLRNFTELVGNFLSYTASAYTPALVMISAAISSGVLVHCLSRSSVTGRLFGMYGAIPLRIGKAVIAILFWLYIGAAVILNAVGLPPTFTNNVLSFALIGLFGLLLTVSLTKRLESLARRGQVPMAVIVPQALAVVCCVLWMIISEGRYGDLSAIWADAAALASSQALQMAIILAGWIAMRIASPISAGDELSRMASSLGGLLIIVASALTGFATVYMLSPGYVLTGYLQRYAPLSSFINFIPLTITFVAVASVLREEILGLSKRPWWRALHYSGKSNTVRLRPHPQVVAADTIPILASALALAFLGGYWLLLQTIYIHRLPPDHMVFLQNLRNPPFAGASFVVSTYAAPVAVQTDQWAYFDPAISRGEIEAVNGQEHLIRDYRYLWLADRDTNEDYKRPNYYLCIAPQNFSMAAHPEIRQAIGCSKTSLVENAGKIDLDTVTTRLVAKDPSGRDRWAILQFDWQDDR